MSGPSGSEDESTVRALLTLAASGVAVDFAEGQPTASERAALRLGKLCGRRRGDLTLTHPGDQTRYLWPDAWARAVDDLGALEEAGVEVRVDFQPTGSEPA